MEPLKHVRNVNVDHHDPEPLSRISIIHIYKIKHSGAPYM